MCSSARSGSGGGIPGGFWLGAGLGFIFSTVAVIAAIEFSQRRPLRYRSRADGHSLPDHDLVDDLSSAVSEGLSVLAAAARQVSDTFGDARRELIRFGLEGSAGNVGGTSSSADGWYFEDDLTDAPEPEHETDAPPSDIETHAAD